MDADDTTDDTPSARQLLHAATGDRDAEAHALADRADEGEDAARAAVEHAHGDRAGRPKPESDVASAADARAEARHD